MNEVVTKRGVELMNDPTMGGDRQEVVDTIQIEGGRLIVYRAIYFISDGCGYEEERVRFVPEFGSVNSFDVITHPRLPLSHDQNNKHNEA